MSSPASPAETRAFILERLVGDIGEPDQIVGAARTLAARALPGIMQALQDTLSAPVEVEVTAIELARFAEALPSTSNHAMTIIASAASPDALLISIDNDAIALVVSTLFGGDPDQAVAPIARDLSPLETEVATMVFDQLAQVLDTAGSAPLELKLPAPPAITGTEMLKHILRDGPSVRIALSLATKGACGNISLMMPQRVILKLRGDSAPPSKAGAAPTTEWRARFSEEVMRSTVTLEATMPLARLTLGDLAGFEPGQVIELEETAQSHARLTSRKKVLFVCEFGKLGQNYTVRIRHPYDAGQDFIDGLLPG